MTAEPSSESTGRGGVASRFRTALLILVAALLFLALGQALMTGLGDLEFDPTPDPIPDAPEHGPTEPAPDFGAPPTDEQRVDHWLRTFTVGDQDDVAWAQRQFAAGGALARRRAIGTAARSLTSNAALVQSLLDFLIAHPGDDVLPLALEALTNPDADVAWRAADAIGGCSSDVAREAAGPLAAQAAEREGKTVSHCLAALARLGGPECLAALRDLMDGLEPNYRGQAYAAIGLSGATETAPLLRSRFQVEDDPTRKLMAASALVRLGNRSAVPWLEQQLEDVAAGSAHHDHVVEALARAHSPAALAHMRGLFRTEVSAERAEWVTALLVNFPFEDVRDLLGDLSQRHFPPTGAPNSKMVRVNAWEQRLRGGGREDQDLLLKLLSAGGAEAVQDREVAVLTLGRVRRPDSLPAILAEVKRTRQGDRLEQLLVRAVALIGDPAGAETIVRAFVRDGSDYAAGGAAFGVWPGLAEPTDALAEALGPLLLRALDGAWGEPEKSGLYHLLLAAGRFAGPEVTGVASRYLKHPDPPIRHAAAACLAETGGAGARAALEAAWDRPQDDVTREVLRTALERLHYRAEAR